MNTMTLSYVAFVLLFIAVAGYFLFPQNTSITVTDISAKDQSYGPPEVTATFTNGAAATEVKYWIEMPGSPKRNCPGQVNLKANETRSVTFQCQPLRNYNGQFTVQTGPAE